MRVKIILSSLLVSHLCYGASPGDHTIELPPTPTPSYLAGKFSGSATLTTNYLFYGISQTTNKPAIQGTFKYQWDCGIYASVFSSSVKFTGPSVYEGAYLELDPMLGFSKQFDNGFGFDIYALRYTYPGNRTANYNEVNLVGIYSYFSARIAHSQNEFATHRPGTYYRLAVDYPFPDCVQIPITGLTAGASVGHFDLPVEAGFSYNDFRIYLSKTISAATKLTLTYSDTNHKNPPYDGPHVILDFTVLF